MNPPVPLRPLEAKLLAACPPGRWDDVRLLIAVSGGADSVALAKALHRLVTAELAAPAPLLALAHFDHGLRGAQSTADERFVCQLAQALDLECLVGRDENLASATHPDGLEAAARAARYRFLLATAEQWGARYALTGHTADDQAETVLHHLVRGSGLAGLAGIPRTRVLSPAVTLLRPMLAIRRGEIIEYLAALEQAYCSDATNDDRALTRNRIRHDLLPLLARDYGAGVVDSLLRTSAVAGEAQRFIERQAEALLEASLTESAPNRLVLDTRRLQAADRHLVRELFVLLWRRQNWPRQAMGWEQWNLLADLVTESTPAATIMLPGAISAQKTGEQLVLARSDS